MTDKHLPGALHRDTLAVHAAADRSQYGENSEALFLTSGYVQPDAETAARRFGGQEQGYTYSRLGNPTVTSMELRLAALEGQFDRGRHLGDQHQRGLQAGSRSARPEVRLPQGPPGVD